MIYRRENWSKWETCDYRPPDLRLDPEKDERLITWMINRGSQRLRAMLMARYAYSEVPALPVNTDDPGDEDYAPYLVLREQVMRESDYWVLKTAAFEAPEAMMRRFAFCRLTGFYWPGDECDAYSYRTYGCGLKSGVSREDIRDLCRELIDRRGEFAAEAERWLSQLDRIPDETLSDWASDGLERTGDDAPDARLRRKMLLAARRAGEHALEDAVCAVFDAWVLNEYERELHAKASRLRVDAMDDLSRRADDWLNHRGAPLGDPEAAIISALRASGLWKAETTGERVHEIAWAPSRRSAQHSYFLWMAHWYGLGTKDGEADDALALERLADAAGRGHMRALDTIVHLYDAGKDVRRNFKLALQWQEKKAELCRRAYEAQPGPANRSEYLASLRKLGDMLTEEGYARRAKPWYRQAEALEEGNG